MSEKFLIENEPALTLTTMLSSTPETVDSTDAEHTRPCRVVENSPATTGEKEPRHPLR